MLLGMNDNPNDDILKYISKTVMNFSVSGA